MASNQSDDELFTRAISGYREAFLVRHSHLPETQRNQLWRQRISAFLPAIERDSSPEKLGKRSRQEAVPRTIPSGSGLPQAKRRATVRVSWSLAFISLLYATLTLHNCVASSPNHGLTIYRPQVYP